MQGHAGVGLMNSTALCLCVSMVLAISNALSPRTDRITGRRARFVRLCVARAGGVFASGDISRRTGALDWMACLNPHRTLYVFGV